MGQEVEEAIHKTMDGQIGYPMAGFHKGMIESTSFVGDKFFSKKLVSGAIKIKAIDGLIPIKFEKRDIYTRQVLHSTKVSPRFHGWSAELIIEYDKNNIAPQDIVTLLTYSGYYYGIGADRPKGRDGGSGVHGMYEVK